MANTLRLGLVKKDPAVDGKENFSIKTMLNDNWDTIDANMALNADLILHIADEKLHVTQKMKDDWDQAILSLRRNQLDLALEAETLKGAVLTGVSSNIFIESFINTNDITSLNGALKHDAVNQKIYLS